MILLYFTKDVNYFLPFLYNMNVRFERKSSVREDLIVKWPPYRLFIAKYRDDTTSNKVAQ